MRHPHSRRAPSCRRFAATAVGMLLTGCSAAAPTQAAQMAATLNHSYQTGVATITLSGAVDFVHVLGRAHISGFTDTHGVITEVDLNEHAIAGQPE